MSSLSRQARAASATDIDVLTSHEDEQTGRDGMAGCGRPTSPSVVRADVLPVPILLAHHGCALARDLCSGFVWRAGVPAHKGLFRLRLRY